MITPRWALLLALVAWKCWSQGTPIFESSVGSITSSPDFNVTVTFDQEIIEFGASNLSLVCTGGSGYVGSIFQVDRNRGVLIVPVFTVSDGVYSLSYTAQEDVNIVVSRGHDIFWYPVSLNYVDHAHTKQCIFLLDSTAPTLTIDVEGGRRVNQPMVTAVITFSEEVEGLGPSSMSLSAASPAGGPGVAEVGQIIAVVESGDPRKYFVTIFLRQYGTYELGLRRSSVADLAGNLAEGLSITLEYDGSRARPVFQTTSLITKESVVSLSLTFGRQVRLSETTPVQVVLSGQGSATVLPLRVVDEETGGFELLLENLTCQGDIAVTVPEGFATDLFGNVAYSSTLNITRGGWVACLVFYRAFLYYL